MVGHWFDQLNNFATEWAPVFLLLLFAFVAWVLWKTVGMMPRTTPATSAQLVVVFAPVIMLAGLTRGIIPAVFQSSHAVSPMTTKNASGSQVVAKSATSWNQCPTISRLIGRKGRIP